MLDNGGKRGLFLRQKYDHMGIPEVRGLTAVKDVTTKGPAVLDGASLKLSSLSSQSLKDSGGRVVHYPVVDPLISGIPICCKKYSS
jgi:hypothetical protein